MGRFRRSGHEEEFTPGDPGGRRERAGYRRGGHTLRKIEIDSRYGVRAFVIGTLALTRQSDALRVADRRPRSRIRAPLAPEPAWPYRRRRRQREMRHGAGPEATP